MQFKDTKVLIDGIHENTAGFFSGLSKQVLEDLMEGGKPLFENIDYILFTHSHMDHFSADYTEQFLKKHRVKGFMMPDRQTWRYSSLRETARARAEKLWLLALPLGKSMEVKLAEALTLKVFCSIHAGKEHQDTENFCYLLNFQGQRMLILGDSDYNAQYFFNMLDNETIDVLFINPLFLNLMSGRKVIRTINPRKLVIYHIPFEETGGLNIRGMVAKDAEKYKNILPPMEILWNELQDIALGDE